MTLINLVKYRYDIDQDSYTFEKMKSLVDGRWWDHYSEFSPKELRKAYKEVELV